jgi:hypothetical protein
MSKQPVFRMSRYRFQFAYATWTGATVTVYVTTDDEKVARWVAAQEMDRRYAALDREPPVGWTLTLLNRSGPHPPKERK